MKTKLKKAKPLRQSKTMQEFYDSAKCIARVKAEDWAKVPKLEEENAKLCGEQLACKIAKKEPLSLEELAEVLLITMMVRDLNERNERLDKLKNL